MTIKLTAAYMAIGLITAPNALKVQDHWDNGQLELVDQLTDYADFSWRLADAAYNCLGSAPGVVQYEVDEEFGAWFGGTILTLEPGHAPTTEACEHWLRIAMYDFFKKGVADGAGGDTLRAELTRALAAVEFKEPA